VTLWMMNEINKLGRMLFAYSTFICGLNEGLLGQELGQAKRSTRFDR
jgi:hypothetical protein